MNDICSSHHGGNAESREAFSTSNYDNQRLEVFGYFQKHPEGITRSEGCQESQIPWQSFAARCTELYQNDWLVKIPCEQLKAGDRPYLRRKTPRGRNAAVLRVHPGWNPSWPIKVKSYPKAKVTPTPEVAE